MDHDVVTLEYARRKYGTFVILMGVSEIFGSPKPWDSILTWQILG